MKQCPSCKTTYTDETLSFCLADGAPLRFAANDEELTVAGRRGNVRVDIPHDEPWGTPPESEHSSGRWIKILLGLILLGGIAIIAVGGLGALIYYNSGGRNGDIVVKSPTPSPSPRPTADTEKEKLEQELANLQRRLEDQKKPPSNVARFPTSDEFPTIIATANSPGDGFLALRREPNSETGMRITKIPHGARLEIGACGEYITTGRNNRGRWCRARYNGYSGWVFDAFVKY